MIKYVAATLLLSVGIIASGCFSDNESEAEESLRVGEDWVEDAAIEQEENVTEVSQGVEAEASGFTRGQCFFCDGDGGKSHWCYEKHPDHLCVAHCQGYGWLVVKPRERRWGHCTNAATSYCAGLGTATLGACWGRRD